jgi:hypothetical protein
MVFLLLLISGCGDRNHECKVESAPHQAGIARVRSRIAGIFPSAQRRACEEKLREPTSCQSHAGVREALHRSWLRLCKAQQPKARNGGHECIRGDAETRSGVLGENVNGDLSLATALEKFGADDRSSLLCDTGFAEGR